MTSLTSKLDEWRIPSVWLNDSQTPIDTLDVCGMVLGATRNVEVGAGVLRIHEYNIPQLAARAYTLNLVSRGRFVLGVGTGRGSGSHAIAQLTDSVNRVRTSYPGEASSLGVFFAALRPRMIGAAVSHANGVLLNFCTPAYVKRVIPKDIKKNFRVAAYVKLFYSEDERQAKKMFVEEFARYDSLSNYHALFETLNVAKTIETLRHESIGQSLPENLLELSLCNPSRREVRHMMSRLVRSGVDMPIVSLYVIGKDTYKLRVAESLASVTF